jgi:DNA uptake protein ComE-like DNA-binding protein
MSFPIPTRAAFLACVTALLIAAGCNFGSDDQRARDEKTRDAVARATERAKPAIEEAGRKLDEVANEAAHEAGAAAKGVRDGWNNSQHSLVDVNSATEGQLLDLPGIGRPQARKIIDNRPYAEKHDLVAKGVLSAATYAKIRDSITVR